jgi:signal transduction histidine kinase
MSDTNDTERALAYYKAQCAELGGQLVRLTESETRARQDAERSRIAARALLATYQLASTKAAHEDISLEFAEIVATRLQVDRVLLLSYDPVDRSFGVIRALGVPHPPTTVGRGCAPPSAFQTFSSLARDELLGRLCREIGCVSAALAFDSDSGVALLVANEYEDRRLHRPFEGADEDLVAGTLNVYLHVTRRRRTEAALADANEHLEESMRELERTLEKANEAHRLKNEFVARMSHELRTPLNAIINVPTVLQRDYVEALIWHCASCSGDYEPDETRVSDEAEQCPECGCPMKLEPKLIFEGNPTEHHHFLKRLEASANYLRRLVDNLLDFSRMEADRLNLHCETVDVDHLFAHLRDTVGALAGDKGVEVSYPDQAGLKVEADFVKLTQVLVNLLDNAIRFTAPEGHVRLTAEESDELGVPGLRLVVEDDGEGIPGDKLSAIFDSFCQVDGSHTRRHGGAGLGLAIVKGIIERHNGRVWAESQLGKGSRFTALLPLRRVVESVPILVEAEAAPLAEGCRVVVIEDNEVQLALFEMVLRRAGYEAVSVASSVDAADRVEQVQPACVVLDVMMPYVSGLTVLKDLKSRPSTQSIPVLVVTAYHANEGTVRSLGGLWLPKPWDSRHLVNMVNDLVKKRQVA